VVISKLTSQLSSDVLYTSRSSWLEIPTTYAVDCLKSPTWSMFRRRTAASIDPDTLSAVICGVDGQAALFHGHRTNSTRQARMGWTCPISTFK
jgi:hypothetical protein